ncbi:MAG: efflux RND transporter periplasmic adaptor subunit [Burkholderiales bacterium]|nr:efflux RND transporter periplasmic adaptor subunit [Burkholderiales bacterium]
MQFKPLVIGALAACALGAGGYGLFRLGQQHGIDNAPTAPAQSEASAASAPAMSLPLSVADGEAATRRHIQAGIQAGDVDPQTGRKVLHYHDPMAPASKFDKPAKSPFMDMMLVPVYADAGGAGDASQVTVSPRVQQSLGLRSAEVVEGRLAPRLSALGSIAFNERDQAVVQARATAYVERLHVRATLDAVRAGQPLAELFVPDWVAAQEEFLALRRMQGSDLAPLIDGARQRMRQAGMSDAQIAALERGGQSQPRITLNAPIGGVVTELALREGMTVTPGSTLFRINGLSTVWANAELPESQAALVRPGAQVRARSPALPGVVFTGRLQALLPDVNPATRTLKARLELANPGARLLPGMSVQMEFDDPRGDKRLLVPTEAVIQTGQRTLVMLAEAGGRFRPVAVEAGIESAGQTEIRSGLRAGQRVVVSAQFLIDSEASLKGIEARLNGVRSNDAPPSAAPAGSKP